MKNTTQKPTSLKNAKLRACIAGGIGIVAVAMVALFAFKGCLSFNIFSSRTDITREFVDNSEWIKRLCELALCQRRTTERFNDSEIKTQNIKIPFWKTFKMPSTANYTISFSVNYTYIVSAERDKWKLKLDNGVLYVAAPPIGIIQPPGIYTDSIKAKYEGGWLVTGEKQRLEEMKKDLSGIVSTRALDKRHISVVREECRKALEGFIWNWLAKNSGYDIKAIRVKFPDESGYGELDKIPAKLTDKRPKL